MASYRVVAWRGSVGCATLWLVLSVASTLEVYDEVPPVDSDFNYQDNNYIDTVPEFTKANAQSQSPPVDLLINELLKRWRERMGYRQIWNPLYLKPELAKEDHISPALEKIGIVKRLVDVLRGSKMQYRPSQSLRLQQKWKIKKGKVIGSQIVCYFKLCSFRSPSQT